MKKLLAVLVVFALIMGTAFADVSTGGGLTAQLAGGDSDGEGADDIATGYSSWWWLSAGKTNEENTAGAKGSIGADMKGNQDGNPKWNPTGDGYFYAWWKPIDQLFIKLGKVGEDGKYWAGADIVDWGFQSNDLLCDPAFNYWNGFTGSVVGSGIGFFGRRTNNFSDLQISLLPIDGLAINLGWMIGSGGDEKFTGRGFKETYSEISAQVVYDIDGVGQAAVGFVNDGEEADKHLYVHWNMPIDVMKVEVGAHFKFNPDIDDYKPPVDIGIGFRYGNPWGDAFWLSARVGMSIGTGEKDASKIGFQLCPSIDLDIFRLYAPLGIGLVVQEDVDAVFAWSFNPYIRKAMGGIEFWAGFKLYNGSGNVEGSQLNGQQWAGLNKASSEIVSWAIPIAFLWAW